MSAARHFDGGGSVGQRHQCHLLRKWVIDTEREDMTGAETRPATRSLDTESLPDDPPSDSGFVVLQLPPPAPALAHVTTQNIRVKVRRAGHDYYRELADQCRL